MKIIDSRKWIPSDNIILEDAASDSVRAVSSILVLAGPGAGKTELLAQKAGYLFETNYCIYPQKILAISFKYDAADNLKKRVSERYGTDISRRFVSLTYDAFAKRILDRFRLSLPEGTTPAPDYTVNDKEIIAAAFKSEGYVQNNYEAVLSSVLLPLDGTSLAVRVWKKLICGFDGYPSCLNFKMISMLAIYIIQSNYQIKKAIQLTYSYVFLDEFQDTTSLQYDLLKTCFLNSNCILTAVGDNKQRIMVWAGAKKTVFNDFLIDFHAERQHLLMNHRSAPRLVNLQKAMYDSLKDDYGKVEASSKWSPEDGEINLIITNTNQLEKKFLCTDIQTKISEGVSPREICILCKQKPQDYTSYLIAELAYNGIKSRIETEYQNLIKEPIIEIIVSFLRLTINRKRPEDWTILLNTACEMYGIDNNLNYDRYYELGENLFSIIKHLDSERSNIKCPQQLNLFIYKIIDHFNIEKIKAHYIAYSNGTYFEDQVASFVNLFWDELKGTDFDWAAGINNFLGMNSIPIMTIHKSKGLEYSAVYFIGLEDAAFWNFRNQSEEDRCAFFVALSRAKQSITFTYSKFRHGMSYPKQEHNEINEFFTLLQTPGMAKIINIDE